MKISQILESSTTAGSISPITTVVGSTQTRNPSIYPGKGGNLLMAKKTKKPYANSLSEGKMKDLSLDLTGGKDGLSDAEFKKKYGKTKEEMRKSMKDNPEPKKVDEATLEEDDLIIVPGQGLKRKTGFIPHGQSRVDHEVEMAKADLYQSMKNAKSVFELIKDRSEDEGLEGWVQEKIIKAADYLNTVREYLEGKRVAEMTGGVIAGGVAFEDEQPVNEKFASKQQAKLMYAVAGDKDVAKKTGVSQKVAKEFIKKSHGQKVSKLPTKVKKD